MTARLAVLRTPAALASDGWRLALGVLVILLIAVAGYYSRTHFHGVINIDTFNRGPFSEFVMESVVAWLAVACALWAVGLLVSRDHSVRVLALFGSQALARFPLLIATGLALLPASQQAIDIVLSIPQQVGLRDGTQREVLGGGSIEFIALVSMRIFNVLAVAWMLLLMYRGYRQAASVTGIRCQASFVVAVVAAELLANAFFIFVIVPTFL